jgi:DNA-binding PadR family transcriptional regulator
MSLKHALLGFLTIQSLTGYDLTKYFESSLKQIWEAKKSQIYKTLKELSHENLVSIEKIHQSKKPNKKIYHITKKGEAELIQWLKSPQELPNFNLPMLVQLCYAYLLEDEQIESLLMFYEEKCLERIKEMEVDTHKKYFRLGNSRMQFLWNLANDNGIAYYNNELVWVRKALNSLKNIPSI